MTKALLATAAFLCACGAVSAQTQPVYWSNTAPDCGTYYTRQLSGGGYVCEHYGVLPWFAAGAGWRSAIRTQAPSTGAVGVYYFYYDANGNEVSLDSTYLNGSSFTNRSSASFSLYANEPAEVDLWGVPIEAPGYTKTSATGHVVVAVQCPDAKTCSQASAQLVYSALPAQPWSLSVPIVWLDQETNAYSAVGLSGGNHTISFALYNDSMGSGTFFLHAYDEMGNEVSQSPASFRVPAGGNVAKVLTDVFPNLPTGLYKLKVTGTYYSSFTALQFEGPSATSLVVSSEGTLDPMTEASTRTAPRLPVKPLDAAAMSQLQRRAK